VRNGFPLLRKAGPPSRDGPQASPRTSPLSDPDQVCPDQRKGTLGIHAPLRTREIEGSGDSPADDLFSGFLFRNTVFETLFHGQMDNCVERAQERRRMGWLSCADYAE
jgi:hypothetical protein